VGANGQRKGLTAGKTVLFDGDPIGVRGDNIFAMVHTCYQTKREGAQFIETEGRANGVQTASLRAPAAATGLNFKRPAANMRGTQPGTFRPRK
jgi:hypothetical protein